MGGKQESINKESQISPDVIVESRPPMNWYTGIGYTDTGIQRLGLNEEFCSLGDGEVKREYDEWSHYTGNPRSKDRGPDEIEKMKGILQKAEATIKTITGFSPQEIDATRFWLEATYKGKFEAPFPFELIER